MSYEQNGNPNNSPVSEAYIKACFKSEFSHYSIPMKEEIANWIPKILSWNWTKGTFSRSFQTIKKTSPQQWTEELWKNEAESRSAVIKEMQREWSEISGIFSDCEWLFSLTKEEQIRYFATVRTIDIQVQERKFTVEKRNPLKKDHTVMAITPTNESIKYAEQNYWKLINAEKQALENAKNRYEIYQQETARLNL